jgi:hypothetical protein
MKIRSVEIRERVRVAFFLLFFVLTVSLNLTCSPEDDPASAPECGSGHVSWYEKAGVCRDDVDNHVVPNSCCGR